MSYKITSNTPQVVSETDNKASLAIRFMLEAIDRTSEPKTPKKHGNLRSDKIKTVDGTKGTIVWTKKYAAAQEDNKYGKFRNYTTPGTGSDFAKDAVKDIVDDSKTYFRRAGL